MMKSFMVERTRSSRAGRERIPAGNRTMQDLMLEGKKYKRNNSVKMKLN